MFEVRLRCRSSRSIDEEIMSIGRSIEEQQLLVDTKRRERVAELLAAMLFVAAVVALWMLRPPSDINIASAAICTAVLALASAVRFETPFGFTVPTQLGFVPVLFAMPLRVVPIAAVVALSIARMPEVLRGNLRASRLVVTLGNASFSIGPVAVFTLAGAAPPDAGAPLLVAALLAQFFVDFSVSVMRDGVGRSASIGSQLRESWWVYAVDAALSGVAYEVARNVPVGAAAALTLVPLLIVLAVFARERNQRLETLLELNRAYRGTAFVLGDVVAADDGYTGEHSRSVVALALEVADRLGLSAEQRRDVEFAALLHDIGKIAIPKEIINKPTKLDQAEWVLVKTHTLEGQKILDRVGGFMHSVGLIVRSHHERWDGGGYPDGLAHEAIPLGARIIACCDTWNAMRTDRVYRKALSREDALGELRAVTGSQLDPQIVAILLEVVAHDEPTEIDGRAPADLGPSAVPIAAAPMAGSAPALDDVRGIDPAMRGMVSSLSIVGGTWLT